MQEALLDRSGLTGWPSVHGSVKQPLIPPVGPAQLHPFLPSLPCLATGA